MSLDPITTTTSSLGKVRVDFVHFQDQVIGDLNFRKKHIHVAWQASGDRVDGESHGFTLRAQASGEFGNRCLSLGDRHTVSGNDDHRTGAFKLSRDRVDVGRNHFPINLKRGSAPGSEPAKDDGNERAVHRTAHDIAEDGPRGSDKSTGHDQQVISKQEPRRSGSPAGVAV